MEDRKKFEINQSRTMIIWDPDKCGINDEISIADYLGPARDEIRAVYTAQAPKRQVAEAEQKPNQRKSEDKPHQLTKLAKETVPLQR